MFIEGLNTTIRRCMREYWGNKKQVNLNYLAFHATSLLLLQRHDVTSKEKNLADRNLKKTQKTVVVPQVRYKRCEKQTNVEPISHYEENLMYDSVGNGPHYISLVACIRFCVFLANCKSRCSLNQGK